MPLVVHSQILRVHAAAIAVGLTTSRNELLAGVPRSLVAAFPTAANASAQLLSDLDRLNDLGRLPDGSVPLQTWLENALALCGPRREAEVFREALPLATASGAATTASTTTASAPAATGGSSFHINFHNSILGSAAFGDGAVATGSIGSAFSSGASPSASPMAARTSTSTPAPTTRTDLQSVYFSYDPADEAFVERLFQALEAQGVATFYFSEHASAGQKLGRVARVGINQHDRVVLFCSKASLTSKRVLNELEETLEREAREGGSARLIPIKLDGFVSSPEWQPPNQDVVHAVQGRVMVDLIGADRDTAKLEKGLRRLVAALKG